MDEWIVGVALLMPSGLIVSLPSPHRHYHLYPMLHDMGVREAPAWQQGFITSKGRFVGRVAAKVFAEAAGQILEHRRNDLLELFSEDVW